MNARLFKLLVQHNQINMRKELHDLEELQKQQLAAIRIAESELEIVLNCDNLQAVTTMAERLNWLWAGADAVLTQIVALKNVLIR